MWYSSDGVTWTQATASVNWTGRVRPTSVAFAAKMWVLGGSTGSYTNEVWSSSDGITWTQATTPSWAGRQNHTSVVFNSKMWVIEGAASGYPHDIWYSTSE